MISEERLRAEPAEEVWLDGKNPLRASHRQPMYPLPLKGKFGRADDLVLNVNSRVLMLSPCASGSAAVNGVVALVLVVCCGMIMAAASLMIVDYKDQGVMDLFIAFISFLMMAIFGAGAVASLRHFRKQPAAYPLQVNRGSGTLVQMQGAKRIEANWNDLRPYIEPVTTVSTVGASTSCNLHLVQPSEDGKRAWKHMMVQNALGLYDCLSTYEFLARYMEGDWEGLPDIYLLPGERPGFWDAYRFGFFNPWIGVPHWEERSPSSRRWMWLFTPLWTILFWPFAMMPIIGSRFGHMPQFSAQDLAQAKYDAVRDGPVPAALQSKIKPPQPLAPGEKLLYWVSMGSGTILWFGFALKMLWLLLD